MAANALGMCIGAVQAVADTKSIGIEWYSEGDSKMALLKKRSASKGETVQAVQKLFEWKPCGIAYRDEAVADALSIYHTAHKASPVVKFLHNDRKN